MLLTDSACMLTRASDRAVGTWATKGGAAGSHAAVNAQTQGTAQGWSCRPRNEYYLVPRGLEPRTLRLLAVRSDQLSYETSGEGSLSRCSTKARGTRQVQQPGLTTGT